MTKTKETIRLGILSCNGRKELYCRKIWVTFSQREEVKQSMHQQANTGQIRRRGYRCNWLSIRCRRGGEAVVDWVVDWVVDRKIVWRTTQSRRLGATDRCQDIILRDPLDGNGEM